MKRTIYILTAAVLLISLLTAIGVFISRDAEIKTQDASYSQAEVLFGEQKAIPRYASDCYPLYSDQSGNTGTEATENINALTNSIPDTPTNSIPNAPTDSIPDTPTNNIPDAPTDEDGVVGAPAVPDSLEAEGAVENPFEVFFSTVSDYATEILSALTLIGSLVLAYAYKKGLIPLITGGIKALGATVSKIKDSAERAEGEGKELGEAISERLSAAESSLTKISEALERTAASLDEMKSDEGERLKTTLVLRAQIDMLYELFMSSALPQYKKDEVGERIAEMRRAVAELDTE